MRLPLFARYSVAEEDGVYEDVLRLKEPLYAKQPRKSEAMSKHAAS
jgi:hypothetical protein